MATRRAKKERVARTQVRRTVEERNLENKHINDIDVRRRGLSLTTIINVAGVHVRRIWKT